MSRRRLTTQAFAYGGLGVNIALNVGVVVMDLAIGSYRAAALQSIAVTACLVWLWLMPKVHEVLDAKLGEAVAQREAAEVVLEELRRLKRVGQLHVDVRGRPAGDRMH